MQLFNKYVRKISQFTLLLSLIVTVFLMSVSCEKKSADNHTETEMQMQTDENIDYNENAVQTIDFDKMNEIVTNAKSLDVEVFFAISVLHSKYIKSLETEANALPESQREQFYTNKKNEFFKTIKFSESQYNEFMEQHVAELNNYINQYPEIIQYLTTDN